MTQTPRESWRRRRSARLYDTEPRMDMRVTGEKMHPPPDVLRGETVHDRTCLGCGCHVCGCEQKFADKMARAECDVLAQRWVCVDCSGHLADYGTTIAGVAEAVMAHACEPKTYGRIDSVTIAGVEHDTIGGAVFLPKFRHYTVHDPADPPETHVDTDGSEYATATSDAWEDAKHGARDVVVALHTAKPERPGEHVYEQMVVRPGEDAVFEAAGPETVKITHYSLWFFEPETFLVNAVGQPGMLFDFVTMSDGMTLTVHTRGGR